MYFNLSKKQILTELFKSWYRFKKGKSNKIDVLIFENSLENNIFELVDEIYNKKYKHGEYEFFQVFDSKKRSIHKALVRDRIVHEFLRKRLEIVFEQKFIRDSFASRKNKGTLKAVKKFRYYLRNNRYTISLDVRKYFACINHEILFEKISKQFNDKSIEYFLSAIIINSFGKNGKGIPLGNSVSQIFANIYLNDLDYFCLKFSNNYIRYNDDIRICTNKIKKPEIKKILEFVEQEKLHIPLNKIHINLNSKGVNFLGYKVFHNYFKLNNKVQKKILSRVNAKNSSSYIGLTENGSNYNFKQKIKSKCYNIDIL